MLNRFKSAVIGAVEGLDVNRSISNESHSRNHLAPKFPYGRPHFLNLGDEEVQMSADHRLRPIIHPNQSLPYYAGYAECVNAGKSKWNEDQAVIQRGVLINESNKYENKFAIPYTYYGIFDGHAGVGAALCAANQLHHILHEKLIDAQDDIWNDFIEQSIPSAKSRDLLLIGALEAAFREMDQVIAEDRNKYQAAGGCTALAALLILGRLYVANAGDSRAVICNGEVCKPMSVDFTPENERDRIRKLAEEQPVLLGREFTFRQYTKQPKPADLGRRILYRDAHMKGWAYKTLQPEDLKMPVISGQGKRSRLMGTIGVTRGFGDHDLLAVYQKTPIKPFLSPNPEVQILSLESVSSNDVLIMGTDGLWDVISNAKTVEVLTKSTKTFSEKERYVSAATCLVGSARGILTNEHYWQLKEGKPASVDDISVFVIPLFPYRIEIEELKQKRNSKTQGRCAQIDDSQNKQLNDGKLLANDVQDKERKRRDKNVKEN